MMPSMNGIFFFKSKQMDEVFSARPTSASASSSSCMGARTRCWACQTLWRRRNTGFCFILLQHYTALQCTASPHFSTLVQFTDLKDSEQECSIFFFFSNKECSIFFFFRTRSMVPYFHLHFHGISVHPVTASDGINRNLRCK